MVDTLSRTERSERMALIGAKDTTPEMAVRSMLHRSGYRYRLHSKNLPGRPDLVFPRRKKVIFVHGCFWHRHSVKSCKLARLPKSNVEFWEAKFAANVRRDEQVQSKLDQLGWSWAVAWECEIGQMEQLKNKLERFLEE